ncbi:MAG: YidC/Oxa1 family membrane protein insertase [Clostridiales bacterium]|nr:YidC/Oxa1 family membrane protein insertase [Clostridiales bacterium]
MIQKNPGMIIGPITSLLGIIFDFIFNLINKILPSNVLGLSIIIITILVRLLVWPLTHKQLKSSAVLQNIQPEINKIREKYPNKKDLDSQKKLNLEIQKLYSKHKINPAGGCLLALMQLPIFMALSQLLSHTYLYIKNIKILYENLADKIMSISNYVNIIKPIAIPKVPSKMIIDLSISKDLQSVVNKFTSTDWQKFLSQISGNTRSQILNLLSQKHSIETMFGIDLTETCGIKFPGAIIPILSLILTFFSSYFMNKSIESNKELKSQQNINLIIMPLMMGWLTLSLSSGVGIYWITNNIVQLIHQLIMISYKNKIKKITKK